MPKTLPQRFWDKVKKTDTCWLWTGGKDGAGYGAFGDGQERLAHRLAYKDLKGPIPEGLQIDHLCCVRHCVNPDHLEAVTQKENILRGNGPCAQNARKQCCPRGHEYIQEMRSGKTIRRCLICTKNYLKIRYLKNREEYITKAKTRYQNNRELCKSKALAYYYKNRDKILAQARKQ
jgi:hypothetical protein